MIRGYFLASGQRRRPFVDAALSFPTIGFRSLDVRLLVDTGADRTLLAPIDARRLVQRFGIDLASLSHGVASTGVGGRAATRTIEAVVRLDGFTTAPFHVPILEPRPGQVLPIPSLLGRDILAGFALFLEDRTERVLLLEPHEADALGLP